MVMAFDSLVLSAHRNSRCLILFCYLMPLDPMILKIILEAFQRIRTYMIAGKMRHQDSAGNTGVIEPGGVQWMTAGSGILHSEMPEQERGLLAGFQLWVNLPASHKMTEPNYQEYKKQNIPQEINGAILTRVIAGKTSKGTQGVINNNFVDPIYWDIKIASASVFEEIIPLDHNAFIYVIDGRVTVGKNQSEVKEGQLAVLEAGAKIMAESAKPSRFLVIAGKPLNEPVERGGPFVMNTRKEIQQAFLDYQSGQLVRS